MDLRGLPTAKIQFRGDKNFVYRFVLKQRTFIPLLVCGVRQPPEDRG